MLYVHCTYYYVDVYDVTLRPTYSLPTTEQFTRHHSMLLLNGEHTFLMFIYYRNMLLNFNFELNIR
jgi:hypothetical protein